MAAYAIAIVRRVTLGDAIARYLQHIDATLEPFGGRYLVHGGAHERLEGDFDGHVVLIQFPDLDRARAWYRSPAYQAIVGLRTQSSDGDTLLVDGVREGHRATDLLVPLGLAAATRDEQRCDS